MRARLREEPAKWRSSSRRRAAKNEPWRERLQQVGSRRAPFLACEERLVQGALAQALPAAGTLLEIGAGSGQLLELGAKADARWVHTDPEAALLEQLRAEHPAANTRVARAERLPVEPQSLAGIVGLCVLDLVADLELTLRGFRQALAPGGAVVHLLDMAPGREAVFRELARAGKVVLPNVFSDPSQARFPQDLLTSERARFEGLLAALEPLQHPLPYVFGRYFARFQHEPFDARAAVAEFEALTARADTGEIFKRALLSAFEVGYKLQLPPPEGQLTASGELFATRLRTLAERAELAVEVCEVRTAWAHLPATDGVKYRSLLLGHTRELAAPPAQLLCADAEPPPEGMALVEAGLFVFVARA